MQEDFIPVPDSVGGHSERKLREKEKEKIEDYLNGTFKISYDHIEGQVSQSKKLMQQIKEKPHDINVWLSCIHEQDSIHF